MVGGELRWRDAATTAVGANLVVIPAPVGDDVAGLDERREPMFVEAFVAKLAIEALDVSVLGRTARFDQDVLAVMLLRQAMKARLVNSGPLSVRTARG